MLSRSLPGWLCRYDAFLADPSRLAAVREALARDGLTPEQRHVLEIMEKTFKVAGGGGGWVGGGGWGGWRVRPGGRGS